MGFETQLLHALTELPSSTTSVPVSHFLPKSVTTTSVRPLSLFYPLAAGHIHMPSELHLAFRPLPAFGILFVTRGSGLLTIGTRHYNLGSSAFALFDLREGCSFRATQELEYDILYFDGSATSSFYEELLNTDGLFLSSLSATGIGSYLRPLLPNGAHSLSPFAFHRHMTDLLCELVEYSAAIETKEAVPEYLRQLKEYIDDNFFMDITLDYLESMYQVNRYRMCREFRTHYLVPPIQYLHMVRIAKARSLLSETTLKIHEISYQVGYENANHFIHHFKKINGITPAAYRNRKKN